MNLLEFAENDKKIIDKHYNKLKLYRLTYDDFKSLSVGDVVYYRYGVSLFECEVYKVTSKRVIVLCYDWLDDSVCFRYILERNYGLYYKE